MSTTSETTHTFKVRCDECDTAAPEARTKVQARSNAMHTGWKFPVWWNGLKHVGRDLCPKCARGFLEDLDRRKIKYML